MTTGETALGAAAAAVFAAACLAVERAEGDRSALKAYPAARERVARADVVLLGNSVLQKGIDEDRLDALVNRRVLKLWEGGAASAWWYVVAKNAVAPAARAPQCVLLFFRDEELTVPTYRVEGDYRLNIEAMSTDNEPELHRLAYGRRWEGLAALLRRNCALYRRRDGLRSAIESALQSCAARVLPRAGKTRFAEAAARVFDEDRMDKGQLNRALDDAEPPDEGAVLDFDRAVPDSFLPLIIETFAARRIPLVLVRAKREARKAADRSEDVRAYGAALARYAAGRGVQLWDFSADDRIRPSHFAGGDHLGSDGRRVFTQILAARLAPYLAGGNEAELDAAQPRGHDDQP